MKNERPSRDVSCCVWGYVLEYDLHADPAHEADVVDSRGFHYIVDRTIRVLVCGIPVEWLVVLTS